MSSRDRRDAREELRGAADLHLADDLAMVTWQQGQRARRRTVWTLGGAAAAAVAAVLLLGGPPLGLISSGEQINPASERTGAPGPEQTGVAETTEERTETTEERTEGPADPLATEGIQDPIPLGYGVAMRPLPGWQPVWQSPESSTFRGPYDMFQTCLQPDGDRISRETCFDGIVITTGLDVDHDSVGAWADRVLPEWNAGLASVDPDSDILGGAASLSFDEVADALIADPEETTLNYAVLNKPTVDDMVITGLERDRFDTGANTGETLTLTLDEDTLCTVDNGPDVSAEIVDCADVVTTIETGPGVPVSVVYDQDSRLLRMSEDPRDIG